MDNGQLIMDNLIFFNFNLIENIAKFNQKNIFHCPFSIFYFKSFCRNQPL